MRYKRIRSIIMAGVLGMLNVLFAYSQPADSLGYYLELAARNNPQINADFSLYKASLEKVPQAGAYPDPELEIGFFLKPMEILSGKQIADFTLMQMFPWFGTRKAARNEATEMARMVEAGCEYAFMEVSSHSIDQRRISGLSFDGGIFTNLTRDHLDYHKTVENYLKAKKKFFDDLPAGTFALTNADDKSGLVMLQNTKAKKLTYSLRTLADFKGKILESHFEGTDLIINGREVMVHFVGRFNAYNLLAVYGAAVSLGKDPEEVLIVLSTLRSVSGRFETIQSPLGYTAIVDYAHTPDALTNVLNGIHEVLDGKGRIITVVGAGGNRDKGKRPLMAKEAAKLSDQVILTSDNPRFEEPDDIINDMVAGLTKMDMERALCITDRTQAIKTATMLAKKGDVILVAGKGHEDYQEIKGVKHHFDDREKLREIFSTQQS